MPEQITLKEFCESHGRSYGYARAQGIGARLESLGVAARLWGSRGPLMVEKAAPWPCRAYSMGSRNFKKRRIA